jgi:hypothetical protein
VKPAAGYRPLAYSSPEAVQTTGTVALGRVAKKRKDTARKTAISRWQKRRIREASIRLISKQAKVLLDELV